MKFRSILLFTLFLAAAESTVAAGQKLPEPNWDRDAALAAARAEDTLETLGGLYLLAREGRSDELMIEVRTIATGRDRSGPERDHILHSLALALGDFEPGAVSPGVLEYLAGTRSLALVAHEENPGMGIPLFNIRAAAAGSLAEWSRQERLDAAPAAAPYVDAEGFLTFLAEASGAKHASLVRSARSRLDPSELEFIVMAAPAMDDARAASIVLAELAPALLGRPATDDLVFGLLEDPELGATAALVLGRSGDEAVLARLADLAAGSESPTSRRASLAIDMFLSVERGR